MRPMILVVDDERDARESLSDFLELKDYQPVQASCLKEAREAVDNDEPHGILLDLHLPDGNGLDWIDELRESSPHLAIVVVTGMGDIPTAVEAMRRGADHFLTKPIDPDNLAVVLKRSLEVGRLRRRDSTQARLSRGDGVFVGESRAARMTWDLAAAAARNDAGVLLHGETGTGKGVLARWIHERSPRSKDAFVEVNCSSLGGDLLSSELFGHRKGAFTSAVENREGLIEVADGGTLFLDEIGDMDIGVQAQFLKVIEEKKFRRIGETRLRHSDFRLICASNKNLREEVKKGNFREDLYFRVCVFPIDVPPIRARMEDLEGLIDFILGNLNGATPRISDDAMDLLRAYSWPGNVRELQNVIERGCIIAEGGILEPRHFPGLTEQSVPSATGSDRERLPADWSLDANEAEHLQRTLNHFRGDVQLAARAVGVSRATFYRKLKKYGILQGQEK